MYDRENKWEVEKWIEEQETCPNRKQAARRFPKVPQRIIRALLQSRKDRERDES